MESREDELPLSHHQFPRKSGLGPLLRLTSGSWWAQHLISPTKPDSHNCELCEDRKRWIPAKLVSPARLRRTHTQMMFMAEQSHRREVGGSQAGWVRASGPASITIGRRANSSLGLKERHKRTGSLKGRAQLAPCANQEDL